MKRRSLSPLQRLKLFEAAKGVCHLCSQRIQVGQTWEVEHVIPLAMGGADDESNMSPAHVACHKVKSRDDADNLSRANRRRAIHRGARAPSTFPGGRGSKFKKRMDGSVVLR